MAERNANSDSRAGKGQRASPRPHQARALALLRAVQPDVEWRTEVALPESSRHVDASTVLTTPSDAWGFLGADLAGRRVLFEVFSRPPSEWALTSAVLKAVWGLGAWVKDGKSTSRPPLCLVVSHGRPTKALGLFPYLEPDGVRGVYRLLCGFELILIDAKRIEDVPGAAFLRSLPFLPAEGGASLNVFMADPSVSGETKETVREAIMTQPEVFGGAEYANAVEAHRAQVTEEVRAEERGKQAKALAEGREEGRTALLSLAKGLVTREEWVALEAVEGLDDLQRRLRVILDRR